MLPYSLKVLWFCLSFTGTIACSVVMYLFSRVIGSYWIPMAYSFFAMLLEGIFCFGIVYDMNPLEMPKSFCIVQAFVMYYSSWSLTGICAAFTFATASSVLWPTCAGNPATSTLAWKNKYYWPVLVFPLVCLSISVPVLLKMNAIQPTDDLHCDVSHPEWGRFLGYAGFSMVLIIPCLFLSAAAARRVLQINRSIQRSHSSCKNSVGYFSSRPQQNASHERSVTLERVKNLLAASPDAETPDFAAAEREHFTLCTDVDVSPSTTVGAFSLSQKRSEVWEAMGVTGQEDYEFDPRKRIRGAMVSSTAVPVPNLAPAVWRLIIFQMTFFIIQSLAALSTIVDIVKQRPTPTPFGSQHVALILACWGPAVVFGHLPAVRRQLAFWKRQ